MKQSQSQSVSLTVKPDLGVLGFTVTKQDMFTQVKDKQVRIPNYATLVRDDDSKPIAVVGRDYGVVQNNELFESIDSQIMSSMSKQQIAGATVTNKVSFNGRVCIRGYVFPGIKPSVALQDKKADIAFRILVVNGFGGSRLIVATGAIDMFCLNEMISGEIVGSYFRRHSKNIQVSDLSGKISQAIETFPEMVKRFQLWSKRKVKDEQVWDYLKQSGFSSRNQERLFEQYKKESDTRGGNSVWALYSALTNFSSHDDGLFALKQTDRDHSASTMLKRERKVVRQVTSEPFKQLIKAA